MKTVRENEKNVSNYEMTLKTEYERHTNDAPL
jgi:hypothetical protein